jgi:opacity protein-like surface antigen
MRISTTLGAFLAIAACGASTTAFADNPIGFYVGAGAGESQIRSDDGNYGYPSYYNDYQFAWKALLGIRPIRMFGVEASYIDFGQPGNCNGYYNGYHNGNCNPNQFGNDSHPTAPAIFAVGYLPIPIPWIDIFGKVGGARLNTNIDTLACTSNLQPCNVNNPTVFVVRQSETFTKFAYGAGVQSKFPFGLTLRAEYERISSQFGDPDALMVSAIWSF